MASPIDLTHSWCVLLAHNQEASLMAKAATEVIVTKLCRFVVELFVGSKGLLSLTSLTIVLFEPPLALLLLQSHFRHS